MANLTLTIGGRPLKIQCSDDNVETVKEIASSISKLIDDEKKENVPFLTSTLIAYLKSRWCFRICFLFNNYIII